MPAARFLLFPLLPLLAACHGFSPSAARQNPRLVVSAGAFDREQSVVSFSAGPSLSKYRALRDEQNRLFALQIDETGEASFILDSLSAGGNRTFQFVRDAPPAPMLKTKRDGRRVTISGTAPIVSYQAEPGDLPRSSVRKIFQRGGYLHPVYTPAGKIITDDFATNHLHHHGIWMAWTKTEFQGRHPDFWNMGDGKGRVEFVGLDKNWSGAVHAGFSARHRFVDTTGSAPVAALNETWTVKAYQMSATNSSHRPRHVFDLISTQTCASSDPLRLPAYHYGGLGFRGHESWNGKEQTRFLTSEGISDRVQGNTTTGRWCHISGEVSGTTAGITIFNHTGNFRSPQPMRLHPTEPFFCYAPQQQGDMEIKPGTPYISRFRFVVQDGEPDSKELDRLWNDYAHPPLAKILP